MEISYHDNGLTIKELKKLLEDYPDEDEYGQPTTVWIETGRGLSSIVTGVYPLNMGDGYSDIELVSDVYTGNY